MDLSQPDIAVSRLIGDYQAAVSRFTGGRYSTPGSITSIALVSVEQDGDQGTGLLIGITVDGRTEVALMSYHALVLMIVCLTRILHEQGLLRSEVLGAEIANILDYYEISEQHTRLE